jgi:protein-S-isoprenylcysteine O-methyltransferase Ste14
MNKLVTSIVLVLMVVVLPLSVKIDWLLTWPMIFMAISVFTMSYTQPNLPSTQEVENKGSRDKKSAHFIMLAAVICSAFPVIDAAYIQKQLPLFDHSATLLGIGLMIFGIGYRWYSIRVLGEFFTAQVEIKANHQLIQHGPYKRLRHPSYTGAFVAIMGMSIFFHSWIGAILCFFIFFPAYIYRIKVEEEALLDQFGSDYVDYQSRTARLFPFIY